MRALLPLVLPLFLLGCRDRTAQPPPADHRSKGGLERGAERVWVPLSATPLRGPATAKVTLIVFTNFQSPYCARANEHLREIQRAYGDAVRIQLRHKPLPSYPDSQRAAEAAVAAAEQGQLWRYHDTLFAHPGALDRGALEQYARAINLDLTRFRDALDSERARKQVDADSILAAQLGVRGAPVIFVNGRPLRGPTDPDALKRLIDEEIAAADELLASGVAPRELYKRRAQLADGSTPAPGKTPVPPRRGLDPDAIYKVEVGRSPFRGPVDARVTLVLWSDFECRQCLQIETTLDPILAAHPREVRLVWKYRPIPDHYDAMLAAEAALAAGSVGKFWPMHDRLFAHPELDRPALEKHAAQLGLDLARFRTALDERTYADHVADDLELSERLRIDSLPLLFMNGRPLPRDLKPDALRARIEQEIERTPRGSLYEALIASGLDSAPGPALSELPPLPTGFYPVEVGRSPVRGPKSAPVTLVTFSDFQCPYCARLEKTLARLRGRYGDRLRIVWKDAPDPEHTAALGAHEAARAAGEQGRFWEMHDKIFAHPYLLSRVAFERYAQELGLDLGRFRAALDQGTFRDAIREETAYGMSLTGPSGTPTVLLNGRLVPGAYPFELFRQLIDEELARAGKRGADQGR